MKKFINQGFQSRSVKHTKRGVEDILSDFSRELSLVKIDMVTNVASRVQDYYSTFDTALSDFHSEIE